MYSCRYGSVHDAYCTESHPFVLPHPFPNPPHSHSSLSPIPPENMEDISSNYISFWRSSHTPHLACHPSLCMWLCFDLLIYNPCRHFSLLLPLSGTVWTQARHGRRLISVTRRSIVTDCSRSPAKSRLFFRFSDRTLTGISGLLWSWTLRRC